jgi:Na+/H+ antiporter NhaC
MSDFGRSGDETASRGDWFRYAWLIALASLVFLVLFGFREGVFLTLLAVYVLGAVIALLVVNWRRRHS